MGGWWYARNLWTTGTLSGLSEAVMLRGTSPIAMLRHARGVPWRTAVDSILFSHLYFGGWSSLMVRSWMYHVFYAVIAVAAVGLVFAWRRTELRPLAAIYGLFWIAQLYNVVLLYVTKGVPTSMGWYLYAVVGAEVVVCTAGLQAMLRRWAAAVGVVLFALLDLYAMHFVALPYYAGIIRHKANGALEAFHLSDGRRLMEHLGVGWGLYVAATFAIVALTYSARPNK